ncbi:MAG: acyltransferase family protein [Calditrichaceae bacterium]|nr:acyltransferase family protein [Calditrichaceae bacterium]MBN2708232.1 acyltransferase family protein [Calditrichaceae bacterium]RQV92255.1 MAG: glucan biosynthesis protein [Calditrichota bacterium]
MEIARERRYDVDWIRVIAFDILILYHVGMFFVPWDFHIKNNSIVNWIQLPMLFANQWRLPILFIVSGMGTRFALSSKSSTEYLKERFIRLFIPLIVGMLIIVPPQVYIERLTQGMKFDSFFHYYSQTFNGVYPEGNFSWHHLWFLPYLFLMSVIATPLFLYLRNKNNGFLFLTRDIFKNQSISLYLFAIPLFVVELYLAPLFPVTHALINDYYAFIFYFFLFITGFILISLGEQFWGAVDRIKFYALLTGIICFPMLIWVWQNAHDSMIFPILKTMNMWSWILAIFGYAAKYLNKKSKLLAYRNQAVYPFYIIHQTIMIVIGYWLMNDSMHYFWKMMIMIAGTFGFSWLIYEFLIKRITILRPLFGLKH